MADFTALKTAIQTYIKQNGNEEITGEKLQEILLSMVTTLGDSAINDLVTALNDEVAARQNADGTLQQNITNEATARGNADTALGGRIDDEATARANGDMALSNRLGSTITAENTAADQIGAEAEARATADAALQELIDGITDNIENGYVYAGIATPSSTPATGKVFYLALTAGTYTNFGSTVVSQGINILKYNGSAWSLDAFIGIDDVPTPSSTGIPKSGGTFDFVMKNGSAFDISAHFASGGTLATYADLSAALTALNTLPAAYKRGGMSIRFVLTSDNKYVQYRLMSDSFDTTVSNWQGVDDEPTAGSENMVKSGGVADTYGFYIENPEWLYVITDHEKHVVAGIKSDGNIEWSVGVPAPVRDAINAKVADLVENDRLERVPVLDDFIGELTEGQWNLNGLLNLKVDKQTGKGLVPVQYVQESEDSEYIQVITDSEDKIIEGTKFDGTKVIGGDAQIKGNITISRGATILGEADIQGAINAETVNAGTVNAGNIPIDIIDNSEYIQVITDSENKIVEGTNNRGEKYVNKFDAATEDMIRGIIEIPDNIPSLISIPMLDANFISPLPITIIGTKGNEDAQYIFSVVSGDNANIRFKFRITDNLLNNNDSAVIASYGSAKVKAECSALQQYTKTMQVGGVSTNVKYPTLTGGIRFVEDSSFYEFDTPIAFSIRYNGESIDVGIKNDGTNLTLRVDEQEYVYTLANYDSVYELYKAIELNTSFDINYKELEGHTCDELAIFPECSMINTYYNAEDTTEAYENASAPFFVPYAKDNLWHQVEMVKIGNNLYLTVDGCAYKQYSVSNIEELVLGGDCKVLFKDLEISLNSVLDAEISGSYIVSSASPCLIIYEGHGLQDKPADDIDGSQTYTTGMDTSVDRLYYVFRKAIEKGYVPVTVDNIVRYFNREKYLPKRCFVPIFDDFRWQNCLDLANRKVFTELNVYPALAIIYNASTPIVFDGDTISKKEAAEICLRNNFQLLNHLEHTATTVTNPALLMDKLKNDVLQADKILVDGMTIVYPGGRQDLYVCNTLKFMGLKLGIAVAGPSVVNNPLYINRYNLIRVELGARVTLESIINKLY